MDGRELVVFALGILASAAKDHPDHLEHAVGVLSPEQQALVAKGTAVLAGLLPIAAHLDAGRQMDQPLGPFGSAEMDGGYQA